MFIVINLLIGLTWLITEHTLVAWAVWHAVSLIFTIPAALTTLALDSQGGDGAVYDILLTVAFSLAIVIIVL